MTKLWLIAQTVVLMLGALIVIVLWPFMRVIQMIMNVYPYMLDRTKEGLMEVAKKWHPSMEGQ